jgi:HAD superfamily hydrolase (TIGR01549 family)
MLKAVLFDLDDTLIDWGHFNDNWERIETGHLRRLFTHMQSAHGFQEAQFEPFARAYFRRVRAAWSNARGGGLVAPRLTEILIEAAQADTAHGLRYEAVDQDAWLDAYAWETPAHCNVFPDVPPALQTLRAHGIRTGIITNAFQPMRLRDIELESHGLMPYFPECRFSAADLGHLKPHPSVFHAALECLGTTPQETVFVGDNPIADIAGAQGVGMKGVLRIKHPHQAPISGLVVPDGAVNTLTDLLTLLDRWYEGWRTPLADRG